MIRFRLSDKDNAAFGLTTGTWLEYDETTLTIGEQRLVKRETGMSMLDVANGMKTGDLDSTAGLAFLALRRRGVAVDWTGANFEAVDLLGIEWEDDGGKAGSPTTDSTDG